MRRAYLAVWAQPARWCAWRDRQRACHGQCGHRLGHRAWRHPHHGPRPILGPGQSASGFRYWSVVALGSSRGAWGTDSPARSARLAGNSHRL